MEREAGDGHMRFVLLPPGPLTVRHRATVSLIDINLNPVEHRMAVNSDVATTASVPADSIAFWPKGGDYFLETTNFLPGLVVEVSPDYWEESMHRAFGPNAAVRLDFLNYKRDPIAAELGQAGIRLLMADYREEEPTDRLVLEGIGLGLIARIAERLEDDQSLDAGMPTPRALVRQKLIRASEYIEDRLSEGLSVADIASELSMSPSHFARSFKLAMGVGPARYVRIRRVERAKLMLLDPRLKAADVAEACGFSSQAHLSRVFKEFCGVTPGTYRREAGV